MRCVVDASIVIKWFVHETDSRDALTLRTRHRLLAPDLLTAEFGNLLATKVRVGDLDIARAEMAAESLAASGIELRAMVELGRVPDDGVASRSHLDAGFGRAGQAATAGRLTMGSSLIGAMLSSVM